MAIRDEIIRLVLETKGEKDAAALSKAFDSIAESAKDAESPAAKLIAELEKLSQTSKNIQGLVSLKAQLTETGTKLEQAKDKLANLSAELAKEETVSKKAAKELKAAEQAVVSLTAQQNQLTIALRKTEGALVKAGVDTTKLASAERTLAAETGTVTQQIKQLAAQTTKAGANTEKVASGFDRLTSSLKGLAAGALAYLSLQKLKDAIVGVADAGEKLEDLQKRFATAFGGLDQGTAALEKVREKARELPISFEEVSDAAIKLRQFGFDPFNGSLQALIDNQQALNQSSDGLSTTIDTLGKAYAKGELSTKALVALTSQGIPAFELLANSMGLSEAKVRDLAASGSLGRKEIADLVSELGKLRTGAAAGELGDLDGQINKLKDGFEQFKQTIAESGVLDFFREQLKKLNASVTEAANNGKLKQIAQSVSDGIIATANAVKSGVQFVYDYSAAIINLGKAYAAIKIASFVGGVASATQALSKAIATTIGLTAATQAAGAATTGVTGILGKLGTAIGLVWAGVRGLFTFLKANPITAALSIAITAVVEKSYEWYKVTNLVKEKEQELVDTRQELIDKTNELKNTNQQYADTAILYAKDLQLASREQLLLYEKQLEGAIKFQEAQKLNAKLTGNQDGIDAAVVALFRYQKALSDTQGLLSKTKVDWSTALDGDGLKKELQGITSDAKVAAKQLGELFTNLDFANPRALGDLALAVASLGAESAKSAVVIREGLGEALKNLSGEQLLAFQTAAVASFKTMGTSAQDTALVLNSTLQTALERLGLSGAQLGVKFTKSGQDIIATFQTVIQSAQATGQQIEAAFRSALDKTATVEEAQKLGELLEQAGQRGTLSFQQTERAAAALQNRLGQLKDNVDPLSEAFRVLGIKSQQELNRAAQTAKGAFDQIVQAFQAGQRPIEDVRRAFTAYAQAALAASKDGTQFAQEQVVEQLKIKASVLGVADALKDVGIVGKESGDQVAGAYGKARESLDGAADAAGRLAGNTAQSANATADAAQQTQQAVQVAQAGVTALNAEQEKAQQILNEQLYKVGNLSQISLESARFVLQELGGLIGDQATELSQRISQLESVAQQAEQSALQLQQLRDQLRDENDRIIGNQADLENRRYQEQLKQIADLAKQSGFANRQLAEEAKKQADELHKRKLQQIEEEKKAQSGGSNSGSGRKNSSATSTGGESGGAQSGGVNIVVNNHISAIGDIGDKQSQNLAVQLGRPIQKELERLSRLRF